MMLNIVLFSTFTFLASTTLSYDLVVKAFTNNNVVVLSVPETTGSLRFSSSNNSFRHRQRQDQRLQRRRRHTIFRHQAATTGTTTTTNNDTVGEEAITDSSAKEIEYEYGDGTLLSSKTFQELYSSSPTSNNNDELLLPNWLTQRCIDCGWVYPTIIQKKSLDIILSSKEEEDSDEDNNNNRDVIIQAQTGSGKTLSYLLPILGNIDYSKKSIQALIVVPTRELGLQVSRVAKRLAAGLKQQANNNNDDVDDEQTNDNNIDENSTPSINNKIMIMNILQGTGIKHKRQRAWAWSEPPHIVIGTPDELNNMVRYGGIRYNNVKYVVVDEVDACLLNNAGQFSSNLESTSLHELLSRHLSPTYDDGSSNIDEDDVLSMLNANFGLNSNDNKKQLKQQQQRINNRKNNKNIRQTIFASATIPQHNYFVKQCIQNKWIASSGEDENAKPVFITLKNNEIMPPTIKHTYMVCNDEYNKMNALIRILNKMIINKKPSKNDATETKLLIFCEPNTPLEEMAIQLVSSLGGDKSNNKSKSVCYWKEGYGTKEENENSIIVSALCYEDSLNKRTSSMLGFLGTNNDINIPQGRKQQQVQEQEQEEQMMTKEKEEDEINNINNNNKIRIMLSTDLASRGLDINDINYVINYDLPSDADTYVHRGGRTGRLGKVGVVISIITTKQEFVLKRLTNKLCLSPDDVKLLSRQKKKKT